MQENSALDWSYDRLNYSLRLRQVAVSQRGVAPNTSITGVSTTVNSTGVSGGVVYSSSVLPIASSMPIGGRGGEVMTGLEYALDTGALLGTVTDGARVSMNPGQTKQISTSVPTGGMTESLQDLSLIEQQPRPKSLMKQQKALSRSNNSLDDEIHALVLPRRDYGSTSSIDLLAKEAAACDGSKVHSGRTGVSVIRHAFSPTASCGASKNRSVHFKGGNNKESSSRAFLKRFRNSAKSGAQQSQQKYQPSSVQNTNCGAKETSGTSVELSNPSVCVSSGAESSTSLSVPSSRKSFFHFDCQSLMWQPFGDPLWRHCHRGSHRRRNTGASAASSGSRVLSSYVNEQSGTQTDSSDPENVHESEEQELDDCDQGDGQSNDLVLSCPFFRNELGGESLRLPSLTRYTITAPEMSDSAHDIGENESQRTGLVSQHCTPSCNAASLLEPPGKELLGPDGRTPDEEEEWEIGVSRHFLGSQRNGIGCSNYGSGGKEEKLLMEFVDAGAKYYRKYFENQTHQNWFGIDEEYGAVAISLKRERVSGGGINQPPISDSDSFVALSCSGGRSAAAAAAAQSGQAGSSGGTNTVNSTYMWRVVVRTQRQLVSLRGAIFEEHIPTQCKLSVNKGVPVKDVLQCVVPELPLSCLRLGIPEAVTKLAKLDEQLLPVSYKIGVLLCRSGQCCEEDMYNNEYSSAALDEFMDLLGQKIKLQNFDKFKGGLDNKTDMTGTHSYYTYHGGHEIMFHVSTMLPFTPSNQQQLMRKRHIGNDIVTIIFQEPGALPFSPKTMRSQFQHIFIVVRVYSPNTDHTRYSIAVSRSCDVPPFGPPISHAAVFSKSQEFVDFLLMKAMNGENAAHRSPKFLTMALRSREDNLKDLAVNCVHSACTLDSKAAGAPTKFFLGSGRKKDKHRGRPDLVLQARGALVWSVRVHDFSIDRDVPCLVGIGWDRFVIVDIKQRCVIFTMPCRAVIGWMESEDLSLKIFYNEGEMLSVSHDQKDDLTEMMQRLDVVSPGCHTRVLSFDRAEATNLGFSVRDGNLVVTSVDSESQPFRRGLQQGSRVVDLCGRPITILTSDDIQEVLRVAPDLTLTFIPPDSNNGVRKGVEISDPYLTNRAISFLRKSSTPSSDIIRQLANNSTARGQQTRSTARDGDRRHTVGHVKLPQMDGVEIDAETQAAIGVVNGAGESTAGRGFHANLRRLIDPDYTEEDIRNKAISPSTGEPTPFPCSRFHNRRQSGGGGFGAPIQRTISDESLIGTVSSPLALPRLTSRVATEASLQQDWNRLVHEANQALTGNEVMGSMNRRQHYSSNSVHNQHSHSSQSSARQTPHNQGTQHSTNDLVLSHGLRYDELEKRCAELEAQVKREQEGREQAESECERLRLENAHLRDECSKAAHQLTKFSSWFFSAMDRQLL